MFNRIFATTVLVMLVAGGASAQSLSPSPVLLPGSVNASVGSVGPLEPGNVLGHATVEQGVTAWRRGPVFVVGFVDLTLRTDAQGHAWNNTLPYRTGAKLVVAGAHSVAQVIVGVTGEARHGAPRGIAPTAALAYWAGWQRPTAHGHFPGSVWASSGLTTPSEPGNWITAAHVDQGVTAWRRAGLALVPFAGVTVSVDTDARRWNNRGLVDAGVKLTTRLHGAAVDLGVAQRTTRDWQTGAHAAAPVAFVNLWVGWMPRVTR